MLCTQSLLVLTLLFAVTACNRSSAPAKPAQKQAQAPFKVSLIANGPLTDWGFNQSHRDALDAVKASLGEKVEVQAIGDVPETGDAERTLRRLISAGSDLTIAASFGYQDTTVKLAQEFPNRKFLQAWGFKPSANLGTYSAKMYEAWYVMGLVAGQMSKTHKLGVVAAHPIPPMKWQINAYALGARAVNPATTVSVVFINHWFDPSLASEASESLIGQGCDVLCGVLDNSVAVAKTAEKRGAMLIGHNTDLSQFAPHACLVGTRWLWGKLYSDAVEKMLAGNWKGTDGDLNGGFKEGYVGITDFNAQVPEAVRKTAMDAIEKIKAGELSIYRGPIQDNKGNLVVPEGKTLTHNEIMGMDWLVEGVK
jgi:basic membrane lipoprotein Med (substrate-binding protein (PBP1-ABC) superfamily)